MKIEPNDVFLNVPFDAQYEAAFVALVGALVVLGRQPRCAIEVAEGRDRLDRIVDLIRSCPVSVHDLSRVGASSGGGFRVPRFNMPFEFGIAYAVSQIAPPHRFFVFEERTHRVVVSLSDWKGGDAVIHFGTQRGMLAAVLDCFEKTGRRPTIEELAVFNRRLQRIAHDIKERFPSRTLFKPTPFRELLQAAGELGDVLKLLA